MTCACESCSPTPAPTYTEAHRAACEARWVLGMDKDKRTTYYSSVKKARGTVAANKLIKDVNSTRKA